MGDIEKNPPLEKYHLIITFFCTIHNVNLEKFGRQFGIQITFRIVQSIMHIYYELYNPYDKFEKQSKCKIYSRLYIP